MRSIVYKTTCKVNGKFYIGKHTTTDINDGYLGSGTTIRRAIAKYGYENFEREVLGVYDTEDEAYAAEAEIVTKDLMESELCYNNRTGGDGNYLQSENTKQSISKTLTGTVKTDATKAKMSEARKGVNTWSKGRVRAQWERDKISKTMKGRPCLNGDAVREANLKREKHECPHCGIKCEIGSYNRWHGDKCRRK